MKQFVTDIFVVLVNMFSGSFWNNFRAKQFSKMLRDKTFLTCKYMALYVLVPLFCDPNFSRSLLVFKARLCFIMDLHNQLILSFVHTAQKTTLAIGNFVNIVRLVFDYYLLLYNYSQFYFTSK